MLIPVSTIALPSLHMVCVRSKNRGTQDAIISFCESRALPQNKWSWWSSGYSTHLACKRPEFEFQLDPFFSVNHTAVKRNIYVASEIPSLGNTEI